MKRKYDVKDDFFKEINSEEKAYLLGFFIADGTYSLSFGCKDSYRYQIHQQEVDKCIVEWYKKAIVPEGNLVYKEAYTDKKGTNHKGTYKLRWTSKTMHKDLEIYNIFPKKTEDLTFKFPFELIPEEFIWDFIRGFFDGDGQISYSEETHQFTFAMYGTSEKFMNQLGEIFEKEFNVEKRVEGVQKSKMILYTLRFSANQKRLSFIDALYSKFYKNKTYFLSRKQSKFLNYLLFKYRDNPGDCARLQDIVERRG